MKIQGYLKKVNVVKQMHHYIYSLSTELSTESLLLHPTMDYYISPYYLHITESFEKLRLIARASFQCVTETKHKYKQCSLTILSSECMRKHITQLMKQLVILSEINKQLVGSL